MRYVVVKENTLGIFRGPPEQQHFLTIELLASSEYDLENGPICAARADVRDATLEDFERLRVSPVGHII